MFKNCNLYFLCVCVCVYLWLCVTPVQNNTCWVLPNLAALYWRITGDGQQAIKCLKHALHHSPPPNRVRHTHTHTHTHIDTHTYILYTDMLRTHNNACWTVLFSRIVALLNWLFQEGALLKRHYFMHCTMCYCTMQSGSL